MAWLQQNFVSLFFMLLFVAVVFRGPILARFFKVRDMSVHDLAAKLSADNPPLLLDVRTSREFNNGHIQQAVLAPVSELKQRGPRLLESNTKQDVAVICHSGNRSLLAAVSLRRMGFSTVFNVSGGMAHWESQAYPVKK